MIVLSSIPLRKLSHAMRQLRQNICQVAMGISQVAIKPKCPAFPSVRTYSPIVLGIFPWASLIMFNRLWPNVSSDAHIPGSALDYCPRRRLLAYPHNFPFLLA